MNDYLFLPNQRVRRRSAAEAARGLLLIYAALTAGAFFALPGWSAVAVLIWPYAIAPAAPLETAPLWLALLAAAVLAVLYYRSACAARWIQNSWYLDARHLRRENEALRAELAKGVRVQGVAITRVTAVGWNDGG